MRQGFDDDDDMLEIEVNLQSQVCKLWRLELSDDRKGREERRWERKTFHAQKCQSNNASD